MKRVLSGIQPSGRMHLGNYAGAVRQFVEMQDSHEMFVFVESYHAMTSSRDPTSLRNNTMQAVVDYIVFGLDPDKTNICRQQDVPQVTELARLLACVCSKYMMEKGTSYKDKVERGLPVSIGLYTYPVLQAADILSVDADLVPVGKDQIRTAKLPVIWRKNSTTITVPFSSCLHTACARWRACCRALTGGSCPRVTTTQSIH